MKLLSRPRLLTPEQFEELWANFEEIVAAADKARHADEGRTFDIVDHERWIFGKVDDLKNWMREASEGSKRQ